jgi:hypothetical protein
MTYMDDIDPDNPLTVLQAASCSYRIALGPRAGQKVLSLRPVAGRDEKTAHALCADAHGFSLHAGVRCGTDQRKALERLCRYITRSARARAQQSNCIEVKRFRSMQRANGHREREFSAGTVWLTASWAGNTVADGRKGGLNFLFAKPTRLIVPFSPGGSNDIMARIAAQHFTAGLGQQVIVDNRPGASGIVGTELAAKAPPDGYTLLMMSLTFTVNPSLYRKLPYDTLKDFIPVSLIASAPLMLVVNPALPVKSVK